MQMLIVFKYTYELPPTAQQEKNLSAMQETQV